MTHDYSEFDKPAVGDNAMAQLLALAKEQVSAQEEVAILQRKLDEAQDRLRKVSEKDLPDLMQELRMTTFSTTDGVSIELNETIHTSIPKAMQDEAFGWLESHDQGGMIKRNFVISFGKDEEAWATKFRADLGKRKKPLAVKIERKVEPPTLKAFVTRQLEAGKDIPQELFGVHRRKVSKVVVGT